MTERWYRAHGFAIRSDLPLNAPAAEPAARADIDVRRTGSRAVPGSQPAGGSIISLHNPPYSYHVAAREPGDYLLRYEAACDCLVSSDGATVAVTTDPGSSDEIAGMLVTGSALSFAVMLRGAPVLHASGVVLAEGAALAIGHSGAGKTTTAAELCLAGAPLLADDVVRVERRDGGMIAFPGARELRLRPATAAALRDHLAAFETRDTADGRCGVAFPAAGPGPVPVAAVLLPEMTDEAAGCEFVPISAREAVIEATRHARVGGVLGGRLVADHFALTADLANTIPFLRVVRPRHPLVPSEALAALNRALA